MDLQIILRSIRKADHDYALIEDGDIIGVGVSGGKDSMILLSALHMYSKFVNKHFRVVGITIRLGFPNMDFASIINYCESLNIEYHVVDSKIYEILQLQKDDRDRIRCSLCSKFKKASVIEAAKTFGCNSVAFGHHREDAIETLLLNTIYGGKIATFLPKMFLTRSEMTFIRPLIYTHENEIIAALENNQIPFVKSTCPNDGFTQRQAMKELLHDLYKKYPMAKHNFLHMLHNEENVLLWHKQNSAKEKLKPDFEVLYEIDNQQIIQSKQTFFYVYSSSQKVEISTADAYKVLQKKQSIHYLYENYVLSSLPSKK